jgi:hypothetical protein
MRWRRQLGRTCWLGRRFQLAESGAAPVAQAGKVGDVSESSQASVLTIRVSQYQILTSDDIRCAFEILGLMR